MQTATHTYYHDQLPLQGFVALEKTKNPKPGILVIHDWSGCNEFAKQQAIQFAQQGYVGFAVDMFGHGKLGTTTEEKQALITPLMNDRGLLLARIQAAFHACMHLPEVDSTRIAAIGFCFGGLCALDLARCGTNLVGAVSVHGLLQAPTYPRTQPMTAKILALHGYEDPMVTPAAVNAFCQEMTTAHVDWQMHIYGHTQHAFTNPNAHDLKLGTVYNALSAQRSAKEISRFFEEIFMPVA